LSHRIGTSVEDGLFSALDKAAHDARTSKAEVIRVAVRTFLTEGDLREDTDLDFELPDHLRKQVERERLKEQNRLRHQRIHFPSNVTDRFTRAFEQGDLNPEINPGAIDELRDIWVEDARLLFDEEEQQEKAVALVETLAEKAREAEDVSEFNRLDPDRVFERYGGVRDGRDTEAATDRLDELVDDALDLITDKLGGTTIDDERVSPEEAVGILRNRSDVPDDVAEDAVDRAVERLDGGDGR
jgi:hypothetical protein